MKTAREFTDYGNGLYEGVAQFYPNEVCPFLEYNVLRLVRVANYGFSRLLTGVEWSGAQSGCAVRCNDKNTKQMARLRQRNAAQINAAQINAALEAFDKLRVRHVAAGYKDTSSAFLASFQSTAASLGPEERIKLEVRYKHKTLELLKPVLADPQASKICALYWEYDGKEDANSVIPLLISNCPELAFLWVDFKHCSGFDFASSMLEHPGNKIKVLEMPLNSKGHLPRFFAALEQSQVSALSIYSDGSLEFYRGLCEYLAKDLLSRLKVWVNHKSVRSELMMSLAKCTRLVELGLSACEFFQSTVFTKSVTKLVLFNCTFAGGFDWFFLADSNVRELKLSFIKGVDGDQLGEALAVQLMAKGLDKLHFERCGFVNETLAAIGVKLARIKRLSFGYSDLNDASVELIALALQSPTSEMKELEMEYKDDTASNIENYLVPALKHLNCNLAKVGFRVHDEHKKLQAAAKIVEHQFRNRHALFVLLQGQQVRRLYCPLRRLPVEMFRLVGEVLL